MGDAKKRGNIAFGRLAMMLAGSVFLALGIVGIFIPLLPTTPFLLLAAACYARSSQKFYNWLINNRLLGNYVRNYREGNGIPVNVKIFTISLLWITIGCSALFAVDALFVRIILVLVAIGVTIHVLSVRTANKSKSPLEDMKE
ncbi:MAG: YbaN family protein [Candidatus Thermoplasmatota archaeon]|nr:YbaN family protein [Candidatus Thermoplasmatota archaeon]